MQNEYFKTELAEFKWITIDGVSRLGLGLDGYGCGGR